MWPEACCGKPVTECKCGPDCEHCDCYKENQKNEGRKQIMILKRFKDLAINH